MFAYQKKRHQLRRHIEHLQRQVEQGRGGAGTREELKDHERKLAAFEYEHLLTTANRLGVDIPTHEEKPSWWSSNSSKGMDFGSATVYWLSDAGEAGLSKLIRQEKRKNVEWWIRTVGSIVGLLTGLLGALIGVIALLKK